MLPPAIDQLIAEFAKFPGVGRRSAERMVFDLLSGGGARIDALRGALGSLRDHVSMCPVCGYFQQEGACVLCAGGRRSEQILVVEKPLDVMAVEKAGGYRGHYHVLGGHLSPLKGITPDKIRLRELYERVASAEVQELILATSPSVEGDATALYIARQTEREGLRITRLGRGVPMGGTLEFTDAGTLRMALESRRGMDS